MEPKTKNLPEIEEEEKPPPRPVNFVENRSFLIPKNKLVSFYPYYFQRTLDRNQQQFYHKNRHSLLLKSIQIKIVSQINHCYHLWKEFSSNTTLFDTWDFRFAFWKGYQHSPYFLVLKNQEENLAILPLWYEEDKKNYTWFGSYWQEENKFFVKDQIFTPLLLAACPSPTYLNAIAPEEVLWLKKFVQFKKDDPKYVLDLTSINSVDDFLANLKKKKRYNLKRDKRIIEAKNPRIIFDKFSDFDTLVDLCNKRFWEKGEDTDWEDPRRRQTFRQVIKLAKTNSNYKVRMISVVIGGKTAAVDLIALFNNCYYPLRCGYDIKNFPGIGNYVNLLEIEDALNLGMKKIDFLEISYGWKNKWFKEIPLLEYRKR